MPIYEYRCKKCGFTFEIINNSNNEKPPRLCPACGWKSPKKILSNSSFRLKGRGWSPDCYNVNPGTSYISKR